MAPPLATLVILVALDTAVQVLLFVILGIIIFILQARLLVALVLVLPPPFLFLGCLLTGCVCVDVFECLQLVRLRVLTTAIGQGRCQLAIPGVFCSACWFLSHHVVSVVLLRSLRHWTLSLGRRGQPLALGLSSLLLPCLLLGSAWPRGTHQLLID